jgi:hypothetical protein
MSTFNGRSRRQATIYDVQNKNKSHTLVSSSRLVSSLYYPKLKRAYKKTAMMWMSVEYFCTACPVVSHVDILPPCVEEIRFDPACVEREREKNEVIHVINYPKCCWIAGVLCI